jgi:hypothetical protein
MTGLTMQAPNQMGEVPPQATAIVNSTAAQIETPQPIVEQQIAYNIDPQEMFEGGETKEDVIANTVLNSVTGNSNVLEPAAPIAAEQPVVNSIPANIVEPTQNIEQPTIEVSAPAPAAQPIQEVQPAPAESPIELTISPLTLDNSLSPTPEDVVQPEITNTIVETNQIVEEPVVEQPAPAPDVQPIVITSTPTTDSEGIPTIDSIQTTNIIEMINEPAPTSTEEAAPIVIQPNVIAEPVIENVQGLSNPEPTPEEPTVLSPVITVETPEPSVVEVSSEPVAAPVIDPNLVVETPAEEAAPAEKPAEEPKPFVGSSIGPSLLETLNAMRAARGQNQVPTPEAPAPVEAAPVVENPQPEAATEQTPVEVPTPVIEAAPVAENPVVEAQQSEVIAPVIDPNLVVEKPAEEPAPAEKPAEEPKKYPSGSIGPSLLDTLNAMRAARASAGPVTEEVVAPAPSETPVVETPAPVEVQATPAPTEVVPQEVPIAVPEQPVVETPVVPTEVPVQETVVTPVPEVPVAPEQPVVATPVVEPQPVQSENQIVTPIESALEQNVLISTNPEVPVGNVEQPVPTASLVEAPMVPVEQLAEQPAVEALAQVPVENTVPAAAPQEVPVVPEQPVVETPVVPTEVPITEPVAEPIIPLTPVDSFATQSSQINQEVENLFGNTPNQVQESTIVEQPIVETPVVPTEAPVQEPVVEPVPEVPLVPEQPVVETPVEETLIIEETTPVVEEAPAETPVEEETPVVEEPQQELTGPVIEETKEDNIFSEDNGIFTPTPQEEKEEQPVEEEKKEEVIDGPIIEETKEDNIFTSNEEDNKEEKEEVEEPKEYPRGSLGPSLLETLEKIRNSKVEPTEETEEAKEYPTEETKQEPEKKLTGIDLLMSSNPVTSTRFCDKCGAMLGVEDQTICPNCGEPIE